MTSRNYRYKGPIRDGNLTEEKAGQWELLGMEQRDRQTQFCSLPFRIGDTNEVQVGTSYI